MVRAAVKKSGHRPQKSRRLKVATELAHRHFDLDQGVEQIFLLRKAGAESSAQEPIKLLEINRSTPECGIMPVYFGPSTGVPYPLIVVDVTPREFDRLKAGKLTLPRGWKIGRQIAGRKA